MSRIVVLGLFFWANIFVGLVQGQVVITPLHQNQEFFYLDHLMQVSIINTTNELLKGTLEIYAEDELQATVFTIHSSTLTLAPTGFVQLTSNDWNSGIKYGSSRQAKYLQETGRFPFGEYVFCYRFLSTDGDQQLGVNCQERTIKVMGLPELIYPSDQEAITTKFPVLTWKPPLPLDLPNLHYSIRLVEVRKGQAIAQAIRANPPLITLKKVQEIFLPYPMDGVPLEEDKIYAWQVTAYADRLEIGATDIWTFSLAKEVKDRLQKEMIKESYRVATQKMDDSYYLANRVIYFAFDNKQYDDMLNYEIRAVGENSKTLTDLPEITLKPGMNKIEIDGSQIKGFVTDEKYILKIKDRIGNQFYITFQYSDQIKSLK